MPKFRLVKRQPKSGSTSKPKPAKTGLFKGFGNKFKQVLSAHKKVIDEHPTAATTDPEPADAQGATLQRTRPFSEHDATDADTTITTTFSRPTPTDVGNPSILRALAASLDSDSSKDVHKIAEGIERAALEPTLANIGAIRVSKPKTLKVLHPAPSSKDMVNAAVNSKETLAESSAIKSLRRLDFAPKLEKGRSSNPRIIHCTKSHHDRKTKAKTAYHSESKNVLEDLEKHYEDEIQKLKELHRKELDRCQQEVLSVHDATRKRTEELRSQIFVAETLLSARDVEVANLQDDHEAEVAKNEELQQENENLVDVLKDRDLVINYTRQRKQFLEKSTAKKTQENLCLQKQRKEAEKGRTVMRDLFNEYFKRTTVLEAEVAAKDATLQNLDQEKNGLQTEVNKNVKQIERLQLEVREAAQQVSFFAYQCAEWVYLMDHEDPARTAEVSGLLRLKDETILSLEKQLQASNLALVTEQSLRFQESTRSDCMIKGLQQELNHSSCANEAVLESREVLQSRLEEVAHMFKGKIYHDDMCKAICDAHDSVNVDNSRLIAMIQKSDQLISNANRETSWRSATIIKLEAEIEAGKVRQRELDGEMSTLTRANDSLQWQLDMRPSNSEQVEQLEQRLKDQGAELQASEEETSAIYQQLKHLEDNHSDYAVRQIAAADAHIVEQRKVLQHWKRANKQLQDQLDQVLVDHGEAFDFMWDHHEVRDWDSENIKRRLRFAEGQIAAQRKAHAEDLGKRGPVAVLFGEPDVRFAEDCEE